MTKDEAEAVKRLELIASDGEEHEACDDVRSDIATVLDALKDEQTFVRQLRGQVSVAESMVTECYQLRAKLALYERAMREVAPSHYVIEAALKGDDNE